MNTADSKMPWVIAQLGTGLYGLHCSVVKEMLIMPEICEVPGVPDCMRGVINLRGRVTPLVDLRQRLGMRSSREETESLCDLMAQRAQDHRRWLDELEASVRENRSFALARDPHQCAFGKWYDNFKTDNILVSGFLKKFATPHRQVHTLADEVLGLAGNGRSEQAFTMLDHARSGVLATMLRLFADFQQVVRDNRREIAVVLDGAVGAYAVSVDSVTSVEKLSEADTHELTGKGLDVPGGLVTSVAKRAKSDDLVLILATDSILAPSTCSAMPQA